MTFIEQIQETSKEFNHGKDDQYPILAKAQEELGELAQEVLINQGHHYKPKGKDGIIGEAIDLMVCAVDIIYSEDPTFTEEQMQEILTKKLAKWKEKRL